MAHGVVHFEIAGRDLEALSGFYRALFGWDPEPFGEDYRTVAPGEGPGGGLARLGGDRAPYVTVYLAVDDLEATLATVADLGGTTVTGPTPIPGTGAFATFADPEGNLVGIFQEEPLR